MLTRTERLEGWSGIDRANTQVVELAECFGPVAAELNALEAALGRELRTNSPALQSLVRHISAYAGSMAWMAMEWKKFGKPTALGITRTTTIALTTCPATTMV